MNGDCFLDFIQKFQEFVKCSPEIPILLLMDNHVAHRTYDVIKFCRENGIHVVSFPPHTSHQLQPLDVSVFSPFQSSANTLLSDWVKCNPGRTMTIHDMTPVFNRALENAATERNIKSGFRASGIYPLDRQVFQDIDFMPAETTDRPFDNDAIGEDAASDMNLLGDRFEYDDDDIPMAATIIELPHNRSQQSIGGDDIGADGNDPNVDSLERSLPELGKSSTPHGSISDLSNMLEGIKPLPKAPPRKAATRGRKS